MTLKRKNGKIVYECGTCKRSGVKLWRWYQTFLDHQDLFCADCGCKKMGIENTFDAEGYRDDEEMGLRTDQMESLMPAIPTKEMDTFWGYTSVPMDLVDWWRALPL